MGFFLSIGIASGGQVALYGKAKCWRGSQVSWHQNRQEAYCLGLSFVFCDPLIPYSHGLRVKFLTDSRTALSWMRGGERVTSRSIERIAISRLCDAVADLKEVWARRYDVHPVVDHLPGEHNSQADSLSRLAFSWHIPQGVIFDGRIKGTRGASVTRKSSSPSQAYVLASQDSHRTPREDDVDIDRVSSVLYAISEDHSPHIPNSVNIGIGQPARKDLLDLQHGSPEVAAIMDQLNSAGGCSDPNDMEFVSAGDGLLMRRCRSNAGHGLSRLCFYIPSDSQEGVDFAKRVLHSYHVDSGCLNARYVRWVFSRAFYVKGLRKLALEGAEVHGLLGFTRCGPSCAAPYAAFSNGLVERSISAIKFITRQLASKRSWSSQIHRVLARLNAKPIDGIDLSPHEIFFARPRRFPVDNALHDVNSGALVPADKEQARQRREDGDYVDRLVSEALNASNSASAVKRFPRRGPPKVGTEVLVFVPNPMGGGSYGHEVYRVHRILGGVTLQLVKSNVPPASVTPDIIKEVHYFNTRPYYRSSGGHVSANQ
ncbi:hypothetical protein Pmar_PMAR021590 [Perkinsus marinus ATCC 50983]|uniref:Uncharacterized protein n=1 Tax=Perkinsus marinus (strain ATCC 50983 / TXsc) TaxID=423536 RepID=C5L8E3_PERM5|nr:hypothetical protein Pmar_PMAR021590 [Perkinsus marinus ATCC 50983]EER07000.1 hypothetical protein Pmar_PMAR021590 [Perkinsus marinus ATCC 50983]|eukprot:XP_002775184.1 hypothetical protein Pmar_PMAR021590 [Perkinsus marinus ATCC 50983]